MTKVLLLEDEEGIRSFVRINLKRQGYEVVEAETGEEALEICNRESDITLAILDVMLPGIDGFEVCRVLREQSPSMGIIMLTAKGQGHDKVEGFDCGADDYVTKPFHTPELLARLKALTRRIELEQKDHSSILNVPPFILSLHQRTLFKQEEEIDLTPKEFSIIQLLMEKKNSAVSRDSILNEVWGRNYIGDLKTVDIHIRRIRKKVEDNPSQPVYLTTVWGHGYMWKPGS
ncbi:response regulator transcription factor [Kroppenstedtia pulmonis]|uniref:Response regulator transcription factor n=1 Tax=Kroppenstedtia pulmonis TaxID=1380685 RepID=A0A7D3Y688_9BACL|nr:response regulator transcription factor [Kroppenstedtia pulmonis]QKG85445.1 response regulator transcription factor [Kroppenstedtia pulmonis]